MCVQANADAHSQYIDHLTSAQANYRIHPVVWNNGRCVSVRALSAPAVFVLIVFHLHLCFMLSHGAQHRAHALLWLVPGRHYVFARTTATCDTVCICLDSPTIY